MDKHKPESRERVAGLFYQPLVETSSGDVKSKLSEDESERTNQTSAWRGQTRPSSSSRAIEQRFPFALCDCCHRTKTSWVINYARKGEFAVWRRTCPYCMDPAEHAQMLLMVRDVTLVRRVRIKR